LTEAACLDVSRETSKEGGGENKPLKEYYWLKKKAEGLFFQPLLIG
jgi:hypothetical protein